MQVFPTQLHNFREQRKFVVDPVLSGLQVNLTAVLHNPLAFASGNQRSTRAVATKRFSLFVVFITNDQ